MLDRWRIWTIYGLVILASCNDAPAQQEPTPKTSVSSAHPSEQPSGKASEKSEGSSSFVTDCSGPMHRTFYDDQGKINSGHRVVDLIRPLYSPIPFKFRAREDSPFSLRPSIDGLEGEIYVKYEKWEIYYTYWKRPSYAGIATKAKRSQTRGIVFPDCVDHVEVPVTLVLKTNDGHLNHRMAGIIHLELPQKAQADMSQINIHFVPELDDLRELDSKFEMSKPKINPKDSFGPNYFELRLKFNGGRPSGQLEAIREVVLGDGESRYTDQNPVITAFFEIDRV